MNSTSERAARALDAARPIIARLDPGRHPEDVAADIIEGWNAVETALRTMLGGSSLSGQPLIHELRQRQMLSLDQAHGLIEFLAARDRVRRTEYHPTSADVIAAKDGFSRLEAGLAGAGAPAAGAGGAGMAGAGYGAAGPAAGGPPRSEYAGPPPVPADHTLVVTGRPSRARSPWLLGVVALVLIGGLVAAWYFLWRGAPGSESMRQGLAAYERNQYEAARVHFEKAARDDPENARAHVYLARIARNEGDVQTAIRELTAAIRADTSYAVAYRELGAVMLQTGNYEQARNWYVRAVQRDPGDRASLGYLGCTMMRLGRVQEGMNFLRRAGQGAWSACANAAPVAPGGMPVQPPA